MNMGGGSLWRASSQFPAGLRVLVVDDDPIFLKILEKMLQNCLYEVTTCTRAEVALSMLRESKTRFDIVLSDVHMPDMNGFKLLEHIGLEMDLPVIMMSVDDGKDVVMKGVTHGACDYLIKPVRIEAVKNIWQHVIRKRRNELKELELSGSVVDSDRQRKPSDDTDNASSVNEGSWRNSKRRKSEEEEGEERDGALKKPRVVWSVELHQQFVTAVSQLGIDKAVPKKILELMNVPGLTRENVASHLQKYRLYLRRLSGVSQHQSGMNTAFMGSQEASFGSMSSLDGLDLQALAVSGQLPPQSLATLQTGGLGRSTAISANTGINVPLVDQRNIFSSEIPKLRFGAGLQLSNDGKPMNLLHGLPITMEPKQLAQLQQSVQSFGNVSLQVSEGSSTFLNMPSTSLRKSLLSHVDVVHGNQSSSLMMQMAQSQSRGQLLDEIAASALSSSVGQEVFSNEISGQIMERNGTIVNGRSVELPGNGFPLANTTGVSILTSTGIFQGGGSKELKVPRDSAPSYDIFSELFQGKSQDWGLQNVALTFDASQHVNSLQGKPDLSPSFLTNQDCASMQKNGQNMNTSVIGKSMFLRETIEQGNTKNSTQRPNNPMADNSIKVKTETMPDSRSETVLLPEHFGQDDLMSALLKQQQGVGLVESEYNFDGYTID